MAGEGILWSHIENAFKKGRQIDIYSSGERRRGIIVYADQGLVILKKEEDPARSDPDYVKIAVSKIDFIEDTIGPI